jgi:hypothetical protein
LRRPLVLALTTVLAASVVASAQAGARSHGSMMRGIVITNFKVNADRTVTVFVKLHDWKLYPKLVGSKMNKKDGGHWHIYVNGKYNAYSASPKSGRTTALKKGDYKLYVALANDDHSPVKGADRSKTISVMVD